MSHKDHDSKSKHLKSSKHRTDYPRIAHKEHREEYAAEIAPNRTAFAETDRHEMRSDVQTRDRGREAGKSVGYIGVGLGIASLFMWSIILGPLAAVLGFYAYSQGRKTSGAWAIGLGIVATLSYFVLIPFTR